MQEGRNGNDSNVAGNTSGVSENQNADQIKLNPSGLDNYLRK